MTRRERLEAANSLIGVIASCGRRFWFNPETGAVARMDIDDCGKIWWVNEWFARPEHERLCMSVGNRNLLRRGWTHGGTLRDLAAALCDFVKTGKPMDSFRLGPWLECGDGDMWGYGYENMQTIREAALRLGVTKARESTNNGHSVDTH